jgi:hypothetical protein
MYFFLIKIVINKIHLLLNDLEINRKITKIFKILSLRFEITKLIF